MNATALASTDTNGLTFARPAPVLTPEKAAEYLTLSLSSLARMRIAGNGPKFIRLSPQKIAYRQSDLDEFLASRVRTSTSQL